MRNNIIIVILVSIIGLFFIGVTAHADCRINDQPIGYPEIRKICGDVSTWPTAASCETYAANTLMTNIASFLVEQKTTCAVSGTSIQYVGVKTPTNSSCNQIYKKAAALCKSRGTSTTVETPAPAPKFPMTNSSNGTNNNNNPSNNSSPNTESTGNIGTGRINGVTGSNDNNSPTSRSNAAPSETTTIGPRVYSTVNGTTNITDNTGSYVIDGKKAYKWVDGKKVELTPDETKVVLDNKLKEVDVKLTENKNIQEGLVSNDDKLREKAEKNLKKELDDKKQAAIAKKEADEKAVLENIETERATLATNARTAASTYLSQYASTKNQTDKDNAEACNLAAGSLDQMQNPVQKISGKGAKCQSTGSVAKFICDIVTNPAVQTASSVMAAGSTALTTMSSAYGTCDITQKINAAGQSLVTAGALTCGITKTMCETSCGNSEKAADEIATYKTDVTKCLTISESAETFFMKTKNIKDSSLAQHKECTDHKISQEQMATMVAGMLSTVGQAQICKQKLAAMENTNNTAKIYSMDEMCAQPQNANSTVCKCRSDNTAPGCPGHIAGSGNEGNINKDLNTKGTSNMASLSYGSKIAPTGGASSLDTNLDDLSDEAKKALAAGGDQKQDGSMFGGAGAASAGGGSGTASAAGAAAGTEKKFAEEPKSIGSSFMNAVGSLFGKGGSGGKTSALKEDKFASDKYKQQIKRQITAEQMRSEISSASGMDNWTKIRTRYKSNAGSLIDSN